MKALPFIPFAHFTLPLHAHTQSTSFAELCEWNDVSLCQCEAVRTCGCCWAWSWCVDQLSLIAVTLKQSQQSSSIFGMQTYFLKTLVVNCCSFNRIHTLCNCLHAWLNNKQRMSSFVMCHSLCLHQSNENDDRNTFTALLLIFTFFSPHFNFLHTYVFRIKFSQHSRRIQIAIQSSCWLLITRHN